MKGDMIQIGPGVWVAADGAHQGIENRQAPSERFEVPNLPMGFRRRFLRSSPGSTNIVNSGGYPELNGEIVLPVELVSTLVLPGPSGLRNFLGFRNSSPAAVSIFLAFGAPATLNSWILLTQNTIMLLDTAVPQDDVFAIAGGPGAQLTIVQSILPGEFE